jgi:hypothetical protein
VRELREHERLRVVSDAEAQGAEDIFKRRDVENKTVEEIEKRADAKTPALVFFNAGTQRRRNISRGITPSRF